MKLTREDEHFLEAISAAPRDDEPRLVYSDLLLERESPWGELIAVQCALARRAEQKASRIDDEHAHLLKREHAILRTRKEWWADLLGYPHVVAFERGFPSDVAFESSGALANAHTWLRYFPELERIRVDLIEGEMLRLATIDYLPTRGLMLRPQREPAPGYMFDFLDAGMFVKWIARVAQLETFEIWGDAEPRALEKVLGSPVVSGIRRLLIGSTDAGNALGYGCLCRPDVLVLDAIGAFGEGAGTSNMRHLSINNTLLYSYSIRGLVGSSRHRLKSLSAEGTSLGVAGVSPLPNIVGDYLVSIPGLPGSLEVLDATSTEIGPVGARTYAEGFPLLTTLRVGNCGLTDDDASEVLRLGKNLRHVSFAKNAIGPKTIEALAEHVTAKAPIEHLSLWNTQLGDRGIEILASSSAFSTLESLEISAVGLTEVGARALANSKHLSPALRIELQRSELGNGTKEQDDVLEALRDRFAVVQAV